MRLEDFLAHHNVSKHPFLGEDANTDEIFDKDCIEKVFHPDWGKIWGNPSNPSASIVFGEKGSGKTALQQQITRKLAKYNKDNPESQSLVIEYFDFDSFLKRHKDHIANDQEQKKSRWQFFGGKSRAQDSLAGWDVRDHLDAILSLGITQIVDRILETKTSSYPAANDNKALPLEKLNSEQVRDLLILASCYNTRDVSTRWKRLSKKLGYKNFWKVLFSPAFYAEYVNFGIGAVGTVLGIFAGLALFWTGLGLSIPWLFIVPFLFLLSWLPFWKDVSQRKTLAKDICSSLRTLSLSNSDLLSILKRFWKTDVKRDWFPADNDAEYRYDMLKRLCDVIEPLGFCGLTIIVDRVDEPQLVRGDVDKMYSFVRPILDNKPLSLNRIGLKLLLLDPLLERVDEENRKRGDVMRLDKHNLVRSLRWTGNSLLDLVNKRLQACATEGATPKPETILVFFDEQEVQEQYLLRIFAHLATPRHVFKLLHAIFTAHVMAYSSTNPVWKIKEKTIVQELYKYTNSPENNLKPFNE